MQRNVPRHLTAYIITISLYTLIVGFFFYSQTHHFVSENKPQESVLNMSLSTFVPEVVEVIQIIEKEVLPQKVEEEVIVQKPSIVKPLLPKPIIKKTVQKKPKQKKPKKTQIKQTKTKTSKKKVKQAKQKSKKQASSKQSQSSKAKQNKYWNALRKKIDKYKFYPRIAKKRRMEGKVKVTFTVSNTGKVSNISVNGPKVFHNSAKNAVKKAFPISIKNAPVSLPATINITLNYKVR